MALRTKAEYVASLRDGRRVYYRGARVPDVTAHPVMRIAIDHAAIDYEIADDPRHRDLAVVDGASRYYAVPRTAEDLLRRSELIALCTREGATLVTLIKEIGSDALFALGRIAPRLGGEYAARIAAFHRECRDGDLALAVAQTDVKGDRALSPGQQPDASAYVRVVRRGPA